VTGSTLSINPSAITLAPNTLTSFTALGGSPPVTWGIEGTDTTCERIKHRGIVCSNIESTDPTHAAFQAGPQDGSVTVVAVDTQGNEATVVVTVSGAAADAGAGLPVVDDAGPSGGPTNPPVPFWDGGEPTTDAGTWAGFDANAPPGSDDGGGTTEDGGSASDSGSTSGSDSGTGTDSGVIAPAPDGGFAGGSEDGGTTSDGGTGSPSGSSGGGCGCVVAGKEQAPGSNGAALGGLLLGAALIGRRTRRAAKR
jgi:hypothetical protein